MNNQSGDAIQLSRGLPGRAGPGEHFQILQDWLPGQLDKRLIVIILSREDGQICMIRKVIDQMPCLGVWMKLDGSDNQPSIFVRHLEDIVKVHTNVGFNTYETLFDPYDWVTSFINGCLELPGEVLLVLDGYQQIKASEIHELVTMIVDYLPPQMHIILISQDEPDLPLAHWRVRRQLAEITINAGVA